MGCPLGLVAQGCVLLLVVVQKSRIVGVIILYIEVYKKINILCYILRFTPLKYFLNTYMKFYKYFLFIFCYKRE